MKQDDDNTDEFEEDWDIIDEGEGIDVPHPYDIQQPVAGLGQDASRTGRGSLALGSVVLKGAGVQKGSMESARK